MILPSDFGTAVTAIFNQNEWQSAIEISTAGMRPEDVPIMVDDIAESCKDAKITLQAIVVGLNLISLPADAPYANAWYKHGSMIVIDVNLHDKVIVRRPV